MTSSHTEGKEYREGPAPVAKLAYYDGADYAEVREIYVDQDGTQLQRPQRGGGQRGPVSSVFGKRQRRNMRKRLGRLRLDVDAVAATLTYPPDFKRHSVLGFPTNPADYIRDLNRFLDRISYAHSGLGVVWRLEFQEERGAPHFHLLVYGLTAGTEVSLLETWLSVVGVPAGDVCTIVQQMMKASYGPTTGAVSHLTTVKEHRAWRAYISKVDPEQVKSPHIEHTGRSWGERGRAHLPEAEHVVVDINDSDYYHFYRRTLRRYRAKHANRKLKAAPHNPGLSVLFGGAEVAVRLHAYLDRAPSRVKHDAGPSRPHTPS